MAEANTVGILEIPIMIAVFSLAFPVMFQTASRIDDKYKSTLLIKVFSKDWICVGFFCALLSALVCCGIWALQSPRIIDCGEAINAIVDNYAFYLLRISTIVLVIMTISSMWLIYVYNIPDKLLERLIKQYRKIDKPKEKELYFEAISKIFYYSIRNEGEPLARQLQDFYSEEFASFGDKNNGFPITSTM